MAWLATFDGRVPGRDTTWWALVFNRGMLCISQVLPSLAVAMLPQQEVWSLPLETVVYVAIEVTLNYLLVAGALSLAGKAPYWTTLAQNVAGFSTLSSTAILGFSGGILFLILAKTPDHVGYLMAPGLFGFILAARSNVEDAQRQAELNDQTLELAAQTLDIRDHYTESHSLRVANLAVRLGEHLDLGDRQCELLRIAGSLHDLGKIGVQDDILNKPGPLTAEEWAIMRRHPDVGADMIERHSALAGAALLVRHHHERWDGSGYPHGLKGDVIPFGARILSVADSFDTITDTRLYRPSRMTPVEGVEDISLRAGRWYDPNVVDALRALHGMDPLDLPDRPEVPRQISTLRVLQANPAFAKLLASIGVSALGDPLTQVAALISIYAATHRDLRAVAVGFIAQALGTIVMSGVLGGVADRVARRQLIVSLELVRAALLFSTPFLAGLSVWLIVPILFLLAAVNSVVQPARQAAVPGLVSAGQVGKANAMVAATLTACGAIGYGIAGTALSIPWQHLGISKATNVLFVVDGATFAVAAALVYGISGLGGGATAIHVTGSLRRAWSSAVARPHLSVATVAAFLIAISYPALLAFAYKLEPQAGGETYSGLAVVASLGIFAGSIAVSRFQSIGSMRTAGAGLLVTGLFSLVMTIGAASTYVVAGALFIASIGNPIYAVANQTALVEAAEPSNRGSVMASRFSMVTTASIGGTALGGFITQAYGPLAAYLVLAIGLILLGMFVMAAGRRITNPLYGRAYEEAALVAAAAQPEAK